MTEARLAVVVLVTLGCARALAGEDGLCQKHLSELLAVSEDMGASRDALDAERHGTGVQERQKRIVDRLDRLIAQMEESSDSPDGEPPHGPRGPRGPRGPTAPTPERDGTARQPPVSQPSSPASGENRTTGSTAHGPRAGLGSIGARWGEPPPKIRAAIMSCESAPLPQNYRRMVEIYLLSIAEESRR